MVIYSRETMVSVGDPAPDFTLMANDRTMVTLSESLGNKVVLAFYPAAFTGVCTTEMCTFTNFLGDFENLEAEVLGISVDSIFSNNEFSKLNSIGFPLLSDVNRDATNAFGVGIDFVMPGYVAAQRSVFVIDEDGKIAKSGKIDQLILNQAIDNFKIETYSKSLDVKEFDISFARGLSLEDGCSTITEFTAYLIAEGIKFLNKNNSNKYLFCGGGRKNKFLIESIIRNSNLNKNNFDMIDNFQLNGDYIESQAFAYLAIRSKLNLPISFPNTTRCNAPVIGGKLANNY